MTKPIDQYTNEELQKIWNGVADCFDRGRGYALQVKHNIGFLMLSRETERRGLEIASGNRGQIILKPKS